MAQPVSSSPLVNALAARETVNRARRALNLGQRGLPQPQTAPPAQAPAPGKTAAPSAEPAKQHRPAQAKQQGSPPLAPSFQLEPDVQEQVMQQAQAVSEAMRRERRAKLHRTLGPSRRFMGGGL